MDNSTKFQQQASVKWDFENPASFRPYPFEIIDFPAWKEFMALNWKYPFYASTIYILVIFSLQRYMKNRQPFSLRTLLACWNGVLGVFSILGFCRIFPEFWKILQSDGGFHRSICAREGLNMPMAYWSLLFGLSKYIELGDSLFIVLRKQPLILLQWYHHCTAMILAWVIIPYGEPLTRWLGVMNYGVHGIMYPYFALKSMKVYIPRNFSMIITSLQLTQMIVAVGLNIYSLYIIGTGGECAREPGSLVWVGVIYGSYMYLFADFMYKSYFCKKTKKQ
ncbi:unnamed protein product [Orchesella dallaii]|uniref:Elongation of very long chain fatty acids protein n=1 Tax=Orchesella dallaii TaxID=48710 RepID=A0ABP1QBM1_9HEXA